MNKVIFLLIINILFINNLFSQFAYLDASELVKHINNKGELKSDDQVVYSILSKYLPDSCKLITKETFDNIFNGKVNPFIRLTKRTKQSSTIPFSVFSIGTPDGITINTVNNNKSGLLPIIKDEKLNAVFFLNLKNTLQNNEGLQLILPLTYKFIGIIA